MAGIKYDVADVEAGGGGIEPTPGLYPGKIVSVTHRTKKNDGTKVSDLEVVVDIGPEYVRFWTYIQLPDSENYEKSKWKLREFTDAMGLPPKGEIVPKKLEGKPVMAKTKMRRDDPDRAEIKNLFKPGDESVKPGEAAALANGEGEDYSDWSDEDLTTEIEERGLEMPTGRKSTQKLIDVLEADDAAKAEPEPEPEPEPEEGDGELTEADPGFYGDWTDEDLKEELSAKEVTLAGRFGRNKAIEALVEAAKTADSGDEGDGDGDSPAGGDDYDEWTDQELKDEIADRVKNGLDVKVTGRWTRDKAIAAMRADDSADPF